MVHDRSADRLPGDDAHEVARGIQVEDHEWQVVLTAHDDRRCIHYPQVVRQDLIERQRRVTHGLRILDWIGGVDAVDLRGLDEHVGADFDCPQARGRIRREEWIAGARGEDRHAPLLEMAHGAPANVVLADLVNLQRRHDAHARALALEGVLHSERIDDGGEHAHLIGRHAIHARLGEAGAAEDVASADDETDLNTEADDLGDFNRDAADDGWVDAVILATEQSLAAQFQQNPPVRRRALRHKTSGIRFVPTERSRGPSRETPEDRPWGSSSHIPVLRRSREGPRERSAGTSLDYRLCEACAMTSA